MKGLSVFLKVLNEQFYEARDGIFINIALTNPDVVGWQHGTRDRFPQIEVRPQNAMGKHVFHPLLKESEHPCAEVDTAVTCHAFTLGFHKQRFPQPLPDVSPTPLVNRHITIAAYIIICEVSLTHLHLPQFYRQFLHPMFSPCHT